MLKLQFFPLHPRTTVRLALAQRQWRPDEETKKRQDRSAILQGTTDQVAVWQWALCK